MLFLFMSFQGAELVTCLLAGTKCLAQNNLKMKFILSHNLRTISVVVGKTWQRLVVFGHIVSTDKTGKQAGR